MNQLARIALALVLLGCADAPGGSLSKTITAKVGPRVAFARDFAGFRMWRRYALPEHTLTEGHESSPRRFVYVDRLLPADDSPAPLGTAIVKTIEEGPPEQWEIHAMVKRGDGYNAEGCVDWEFFNLELDDAGAVSIAWRGRGDDASAYTDAEGNQRSCNSCHVYGAQIDYVFSRRLVPALAGPG